MGHQPAQAGGEAAREACVTAGAEMTARAEALSPEVLVKLSGYVTS